MPHHAWLRVPTAGEWAHAQGQFDSGRILGLPMASLNGSTPAVSATLEWIRSWRELRLPPLKRETVRTVCLQIARGTIHPAVAAQPLELGPPGAWIGCPTDGHTMTWRPHWAKPEVPVLMTLVSNAQVDQAEMLAQSRRAAFRAVPGGN